MIKLVAFDWNGTILADTMLWWRFSDQLMKKFFGRGITYEQWSMTFDVPVTKYYLANGLTPRQIEDKGAEMSSFVYGKYERVENRTRTRSGAREVLNYLKRKDIGRVVFSNHPLDRLEYAMDRLKIKNEFDYVIGSDSLHSNRICRNKKDKLHKYIIENNFKMHEVILVGDTREEIEIAAEWGATSVAITGGNNHVKVLKEAGPDYLINNLRELEAIVKGLNK